MYFKYYVFLGNLQYLPGYQCCKFYLSKIKMIFSLQISGFSYFLFLIKKKNKKQLTISVLLSPSTFLSHMVPDVKFQALNFSPLFLSLVSISANTTQFVSLLCSSDCYSSLKAPSFITLFLNLLCDVYFLIA